MARIITTEIQAILRVAETGAQGAEVSRLEAEACSVVAFAINAFGRAQHPVAQATTQSLDLFADDYVRSCVDKALASPVCLRDRARAVLQSFVDATES